MHYEHLRDTLGHNQKQIRIPYWTDWTFSKYFTQIQHTH